MKLAIASGKGGTGKTTVAVSLALALAEDGQSVSYLDCDVEAPNGHLFLQPEWTERRSVDLLIPQVNDDLCTACGDCARACQYHAIVVVGGKTLVFPEMCHGCGSCTLVCPEKAITEVPRSLGVLDAGPARGGIRFAQGLLNVGEPMAVPVIHQLKKWQLDEPADVVVMDSPPGASCPVVESLRGADFVLLVTEPTPFGLHDLKQAAKLTREINLPAGVIINRDGIGDAVVDEFCRQEGLPILMRIPFERQIGEGIAQGKSLLEIRPDYAPRFREMLNTITQILSGREAQA